METTSPFDLKILRRDWIDGVNGPSFLARVRRRLARINDQREAARERGVLIVERDPVAFAAAFFAGVHSRVPVIVGNPRWRRLEWGVVAAQVRPAIVFGKNPWPEPRLSKSGSCKSNGNPLVDPRPSTILIPTGGSSGGVKFAIHRWETLVAAVEGFVGFLGAGPIHSCCVLPLDHVSGLMQLVRSFVSGGRIFFTDFAAQQAGDFPETTPDVALCLSLVPTQLQRLIEEKSGIDRLRQARAVFLGGAPLSAALADRAGELKLPIILSYGMTETAAMVAAQRAEDFLSGSRSVGFSLCHARVDVVDSAGAPRPAGGSGRIRVRTRSLFEGYHGVETQDLRRGFFTGDEGYFDERGCLSILGRSDRLIITGGEKVDPQEVEAAILAMEGVDSVLVVGVPDPEWGQKVVAFYTVVIGESVRSSRWRGILRENLAPHKIPKQMIQVNRLPYNERGKVDRPRIEALCAGGEPGD